MLVLARSENQDVIVGEMMVRVKVLEIRGNSVRLGFEAAREIPIHRGEIYNRILAERLEKFEAKREQPCPAR